MAERSGVAASNLMNANGVGSPVDTVDRDPEVARAS
jgi:hypothetical protein